MFAQGEENEKAEAVKQDSAEVSDKDEHTKFDWHNFKANFDLFDSHLIHSPSISLTVTDFLQ